MLGRSVSILLVGQVSISQYNCIIVLSTEPAYLARPIIVTLIETVPYNHQKLNKSYEQLLSMSSSIYKRASRVKKL